jgi:hypothetical protein
MGVRTRVELIEAGYKPGNTAPCKGCDMLIEWWTTPNQKAMPMSTPKDGVGLEPHWGTCPKAKQFKRRVWNQLPKTKGEK